jgi:dihydroflavonol-4-reductase
LVLGATGFIGGHIVRSAAASGWRVRGLRRRSGAVGAIGDVAGVEWIEGDTDDLPSLRAAMRGCQAVFHCAGAYPHNPRRLAQDVDAAVRQMRRVLDAARAASVRRLVYTSSFTTIGPAGEAERLADERDPYVPGSSGDPYYEAKWAMEVEALAASGSDLATVALCPTAVFGPGDVHLSVSRPLVLAAQGRMPVSVDAPLGVIDVRDVAQAHVAAADRGQPGQRYVLNGHNLRLPELLAATATIAGARPPVVRLPPQLATTLAALAGRLPGVGGEVSYLRTMRLWQPLNNARAAAELGLSPRPLAETLADALAWFRAAGRL